MTATDLPPRVVKFKPGALGLTGEMLSRAQVRDILTRARAALAAGYAVAGACGARKAQLQIVDGINCLRVLSKMEGAA